MIVIFLLCLLPKMRLSIVLEGRYIGYETPIQIILSIFCGLIKISGKIYTIHLQDLLRVRPPNGARPPIGARLPIREDRQSGQDCQTASEEPGKTKAK